MVAVLVTLPSADLIDKETLSPAGAPAGITMLTWNTPGNPGACPANGTSAWIPPTSTVGLAFARQSPSAADLGSSGRNHDVDLEHAGKSRRLSGERHIGLDSADQHRRLGIRAAEPVRCRADAGTVGDRRRHRAQAGDIKES